MNIYLCFYSALEFWRRWSQAHPLALRTFHDQSVTPLAQLPTRCFRTTSTLTASAYLNEDVCSLLSGVDNEDVRAFLSLDPNWLNAHDETSPACPRPPLHVLIPGDRGSRNSQCVIRHRTDVDFPRRSFLCVAPHVFVTAPELTFVHLAKELSFGQLLALGYELCGNYPLPDRSPAPLVRAALTTPQQLVSFADALQQTPGVKLARSVARQVLPKSASPMETEVAALAFTSSKRGGLEMERAALNEPLALSRRAASLTKSGRVVCDLYWERHGIALEYDGRDSHRSAYQQDRDSRKRDALLAHGVEQVTLTSTQFHHIGEFFDLMNYIARRTGRRVRKRSQGHLEKHLNLRRQLRQFHQEHSFMGALV